MRGLLKNNFYGVMDNLKILFGLTGLLGLALLITGDAALLGIFSLLSVPLLGAAMISCMRKESASKWCKYKLTLPVRKKEIVKSQYISHLIWTMAGTGIVALFLLLTVLIHGDRYFYYGFRDAVTLILGGGVLAVFMGAVSYPLYYWWGGEKTEVILLLSVLVSGAVIGGLSLLINTLTGEGMVSDTEYYLSLLVILGVAAAAFAGSYYLTSWIFRQKEY